MIEYYRGRDFGYWNQNREVRRHVPLSAVDRDQRLNVSSELGREGRKRIVGLKRVRDQYVFRRTSIWALTENWEDGVSADGEIRRRQSRVDGLDGGIGR